MAVKPLDIEQAIASVKKALANEPSLSPALAGALETLLLLVSLLVSRRGPASHNSSTPPSADPNRAKSSRRGRSKRRPGGQPGHVGTTLKPIDDPDVIVDLPLDRRTLPTGRHWQLAGTETRQVFDVVLHREVTEYRAEVWVDDTGQRWVAPFPAHVGSRVQYGPTCKAHAVYLSQGQLLPYERVRETFVDQLGLPLSAGTLANFNREAFERLAPFEQAIKPLLAGQSVLHVDETGINIDGQRRWLHTAGNAYFTHYAAHAKRGQEAMNEIGILPYFTGVLCHDHWKPYYRYTACQHALCNAHHLRELERAVEDGQVWAKTMQTLLLDLHQATEAAGGVLAPDDAKVWRQRYRQVVADADVECPAPVAPASGPRRKGRLKRSKARNLLERLRDYEADVLRFIDDANVPFTNNLGERDIRMTKVHQKISGCFRSWKGAAIFCRIRGYLSTCRKNGVATSQALALVFQGQQPAFMSDGTLSSAATAAE